MNWVRFGPTAAYGLNVFIFFFLYLAGFIATSNVPNDIINVRFVIMIGVVMSMAASTSEGKTPG